MWHGRPVNFGICPQPALAKTAARSYPNSTLGRSTIDDRCIVAIAEELQSVKRGVRTPRSRESTTRPPLLVDVVLPIYGIETRLAAEVRVAAVLLM